MKKQLVFIIVLFLMTNSVSTVLAQNLTEFSSDKTEYTNQLEKLLTASKRKDYKASFETFKLNLTAGRFSDDQFVKIHALSNQMLKLKMRANFFVVFLNANNEMINQGVFKDQFDPWIDIMGSYISTIKRSKTKNYLAYLAFSEKLFKYNALRFTSEKGLQWLATSKKYEFKLDKGVISVAFPETDIIGKRKQDSIIIKKTLGVYYPLTLLWEGEKGQADWSRVQLGENVYCTFDKYQIKTKTNNYSVKKVIFHNPTFFSDPQEGSFTDKIVINAGNNGSYPRFRSFRSNIDIKNLGDKIRYRGGFQLHGSSVIGLGGELNKARMDFFKNDDELAITAYADKYVIRRNEYIVAQNVEVSVYFSGDSIFHPSADFRFNIIKRELVLTRTGSGNSKTLFFNSFHNVEMDVEKIGWGIDSDSIEIGQNTIRSAGGRPRKAAFASLNYFDYGKYINYQNISTYNPISTIKAFSEKKNIRELDVEQLAKALNPKYSVRTITPLLLDLVENGFIYYDKENKLVVVKDKTINYAAASRQQIDYDNIKAVSSSRKTNGVINLDNYDLTVNGVNNVILSDSQLVGFKPYTKEIVFQKNRNINFNGTLFAGFTIIDGTDFQFKYDQFKIEGNDIDSVRIRIPDPNRGLDRTGRPYLIPLGTRIEDMKGVISIDQDDNKSSRKNYQEYPMLTSDYPCFVYYDAKGTQGGAYKRDSFFFEINPPFLLDSLDSFDPRGMKFQGKLVSGGIMPDFEETLKLRGDMSLGFKTPTEPGGMEIYGGKGIYKGIISMNNKGLLGEGSVSYLTAKINSEDIIFLPKQLLATADSFNLEKFKGAAYEFPRLRGEQVSVNWQPYQDSMYVETEEKPFEVFDSRFSLTGLAILTPGGLYGDGILDWPEAALTSDNLRFRYNGVTADSSNLRIKTQGSVGIAFSTSNVQADIDFDKQESNFISNSDEVSTNMPYNKYRTSMDEFKWDMKARTIDFKSKDGKAVFLSTHKDQDSLSFTGTTANYNLSTNLLKIEGVPFIQSADAFIYPKDGLVEIERDAKMQTLEDATILADTINKYHTINKTIVNVLGKNRYTARGGFYKYDVDSIKQEIKFDKIDISRTRKGKQKGKLTTVGEGTVLPSQNFYLDKKIFYQGKAKLKADRKELQFEGFAKLLSPAVGDSSWFSIKSAIDRKNVVIDYDVPRNLAGDKVYTGIYIKRDTGLIYPRVMTPIYSRKDRPIFSTKGFLKYDIGNDKFLFGDSLKVLAEGRRGNLMEFHRLKGNIDFEGKYSLVDKLPYVKVDAAGTGKVSSVMGKGSLQTKLNMIVGIDMIIPDKLLNFVIKDLEVNSFDLALASYDKKDYIKKGLAEFIKDDKKLDKIYKEIEEYDRITWPKSEKEYTFLFGNVPMKWNPDRYSLVSQKGIALSYINGVPIHRKVEAYIEMRMSRSKDEMNIYIKSPGGNFYYFNYQNRVLSVVSSNPDFNETVLSLKKKELQFKMKEDGEYYEVKPTGIPAANFFLQRIGVK